MLKPFTDMAVVLLSLMALGHLMRVLAGWELIINTTVVPMWPSVLVFLVLGGLAIMLWRESRRAAAQDILKAVERLQAQGP